MAVRPYGNSTLGHVAAVSRVIDSRTVLIDHANWSERGKIEKNVRAVDVSPANDWSQVRIWYGPSQALGTNHWPVAGFIYNEKPGATGTETARALRQPAAESRPVASPPVTKAAQPRSVRPTSRQSTRTDPIGDIINSLDKNGGDPIKNIIEKLESTRLEEPETTGSVKPAEPADAEPIGATELPEPTGNIGGGEEEPEPAQ